MMQSAKRSVQLDDGTFGYAEVIAIKVTQSFPVHLYIPVQCLLIAFAVNLPA